MEFLEGMTLDQKIGGKPLPVNQLLDLAIHFQMRLTPRTANTFSTAISSRGISL